VNGFLLDTHIWIWFQRADAEHITVEARDEMLRWQTTGKLFGSPISVWEMGLLETSGHLQLGSPVELFVEQGTRDGSIQLLPLTPKILIESTRLPGDIHRDPADRILAATAREHGLTLVTRDKLLLSYGKQGHLNARKL
jgi:PIN domain nuclease of toxin-antitoxin system